MRLEDIGLMGYREAWPRQEAVHEQVLAGADECAILVEYPPVITLGRRAGVDQNLLVPPEYQAGLGVEVVHSHRGGDITFHGTGSSARSESEPATDARC